MNKLIRGCFFFLGLIALANLANAQSSGTIEGTVRDPSGAVIPNATVSAQNATTGVLTTRRQTTRVYLCSSLPQASMEFGRARRAFSRSFTKRSQLTRWQSCL